MMERMFRQYQVHYGDDEEEKMEDTEIGNIKKDLRVLHSCRLLSTFVDTSPSVEGVRVHYTEHCFRKLFNCYLFYKY